MSNQPSDTLRLALALEILSVEIRQVSVLLAQLLPPRPHGPAADTLEEDPVNYPGRQEALLRRYRPQGPQAEQ